MTVELWLLIAALAVYGLYLGAQSLIFRGEHGVIYAATARDEPKTDSALLGRAERALRNINETLIVYVVLALVAHLALPGDPLVFWGAITWLIARIVYLPLYLGGIFMLRSLVWCVSLAGLLMMGWAIVF